MIADRISVLERPNALKLITGRGTGPGIPRPEARDKRFVARIRLIRGSGGFGKEPETPEASRVRRVEATQVIAGRGMVVGGPVRPEARCRRFIPVSRELPGRGGTGQGPMPEAKVVKLTGGSSRPVEWPDPNNAGKPASGSGSFG